MPPDTAAAPFPSGLDPGSARRQAGGLLALFYTIIYGSPLLLGHTSYRVAALLLSALGIGALMLTTTLVLLRRDASWRESLALEHEAWSSTAGWSLVGFLCTYTANIMLTITYVAVRGNLEAITARRMSWLGALAELPVEAILPLAAFVGLWEEIVFRGFLLGRLRACLPTRDDRGARARRDALAVLLSALCFGAGHGYQGLLGMGQTTAAGIVLGALVVRRQSLWPAIGAHLLIDTFGLAAIRVARHLLPAP